MEKNRFEAIASVSDWSLKPLAKYGYLLVLFIPAISSQEYPEKHLITYNGTVSTLNCPKEFAVVRWEGPPNFITYYVYSASGQFGDIGSKASRMYISANFSLIITNTQLEDSGTYQCVKTGRVNMQVVLYTAVSTIEVRIKAAAPNITATAPIDDQKLLATEDTPVSIYCTSRGCYPALTLDLYEGGVNGRLLPTSTSVTRKGETFTVALRYTFTPRRRNDGQQLVCRSHWPTPADVQDSQLTNVTLYLYYRPIVTIQQASVTVNEQTAVPPVDLPCSVDSRPLSKVTWHHNGRVVKQAAEVSSLLYSISSPSRTSYGNYTCMADNGVGQSDSKTYKVEVQFRPLYVSLEKLGIAVADGVDTMSISCVTDSSNPVAVVTWSTDTIQTTTPVTSSSPGPYGGTVTTSTITFRPTRAHDGRTVSCTARNNIFSNLPVSNSTFIDNIRYSPLINNLTDQTVVEGEIIVLKCTASSKPAASFRWANSSDTVAQGNGTTSYNGLNYTITAVSRTQAGTYTCTVDNQIPPNDSKQLKLVVNYQPDIVVTAINTTVHSQSTTLTCGASGVPDLYTYDHWMHTFNGVQVVHPDPLPASRELILTGLSYDHSGVYRCGSSNGVKGIVSYGEGTLLVQSFPVLIGDVANSKEIKAFAVLMKPTMLTFQYFSNAGSGAVQVLKTNGSGEEVGEVYYRSVGVKLSVFLSEITAPGTEVVISITLTEESQFGEYETIVTNSIGHVNLSLIILPEAAPPVDIPSPSVAMIGGVVGGLVGALSIVAAVGVFVWRQRGRRNCTETSRKRVETVGLRDTNGKGTTRTTEIPTESMDSQPYEGLQSRVDNQCYEQLQANRADIVQHDYENNGASQYETLQKSQERDAQTYDQLQLKEYKTSEYENLQLTSI